MFWFMPDPHMLHVPSELQVILPSWQAAPEDAGAEAAEVAAAGAEATGEEATGEPEEAGLVELDPVEPLGSLEPLEPVEPLEPLGSLEPVEPLGSLEPLEPVEPVELGTGTAEEAGVVELDPVEVPEPLEPLEPPELALPQLPVGAPKLAPGAVTTLFPGLGYLTSTPSAIAQVLTPES